MRIAVVGAGGVGGYFGARLAAAGEDVVFIARGPHLRAMRERGLRVTSIAGDLVLRSVSATDDAVSVGIQDVVLVAVKTWQLHEALPAIRALTGPGTLVLPLLNGVEAVDQLAGACDQGHVLGGLARIVSFLRSPGEIDHVGATPHITLGEPGGGTSEQAEGFVRVLSRAGVEAELATDIRSALWQKFLFVVGWGGPSAACAVPVGVLRSLPHTRALMEASMTEIAAVGNARGVSTGAAAVAAAMAFVDGLSPESTTSLQRDVAAGRRSELDAWCGAVSRLGGEAGVPTPVNDLLYATLLPRELSARGELPA